MVFPFSNVQHKALCDNLIRCHLCSTQRGNLGEYFHVVRNRTFNIPSLFLLIIQKTEERSINLRMACLTEDHPPPGGESSESQAIVEQHSNLAIRPPSAPRPART